MWTLSLSASVHAPACTAGLPTSAASAPVVPVHCGGLFSATAVLSVATVTSLESTLPSLALNLTVSAPAWGAVYLIVGVGVSLPSTVAVPFVTCCVIVTWRLPASASVQLPSDAAAPPTWAFTVPVLPVHAGTVLLLVVTVTSFESAVPSLPLNLNVSAPPLVAAYLTVGLGVSLPWMVTSPFVGAWVTVR